MMRRQYFRVAHPYCLSRATRYVWPFSLVAQALTSNDDAKILACLRQLRDTTAGTNQIHESFDCNDAHRYTREWFRWANVLFAELVGRIFDDTPGLLTNVCRGWV